MDPFLQTDGLGSGCWEGDIADVECISRQQPCYSLHHTNGCLVRHGSSDDLQQESEMDNDWEDKSAYREKHRIELFNSDEEEDEDELSTDVHLTIKGRKGDAGAIFIRLKIGDKEGMSCLISFLIRCYYYLAARKLMEPRQNDAFYKGKKTKFRIGKTMS